MYDLFSASYNRNSYVVNKIKTRLSKQTQISEHYSQYFQNFLGGDFFNSLVAKCQRYGTEE